MVSGMDILLVEDDRDLLEFAGELLIELGYQVFTTASAENALKFLENGTHLDLLLSDIKLSGNINGIELARKVMAQRPGIKVILTSGYAEPLEKGCFPFIEKPYRKAELGETVHSVLASK
jgi:DNA-binding NtrC family response regulator